MYLNRIREGLIFQSSEEQRTAKRGPHCSLAHLTVGTTQTRIQYWIKAARENEGKRNWRGNKWRGSAETTQLLTIPATNSVVNAPKFKTFEA